MGKTVIIPTKAELSRRLQIEMNRYNAFKKMLNTDTSEDKDTHAWNANGARAVIVELKWDCEKYLSKNEYPKEYYIPTPAVIDEWKYMTARKKRWYGSTERHMKTYHRYQPDIGRALA